MRFWGDQRQRGSSEQSPAEARHARMGKLGSYRSSRIGPFHAGP